MAYPERRAPRPSGPDRLIATLGWGMHTLLGRQLALQPLAGEVREAARRLRGAKLRDLLPNLRYRVRRDGLRPGALVDCFAAYLAAQGEQAALPDPVPVAAAWMAHGGIAELEEPGACTSALGLAALARAMLDGTVHLVSAREAGARTLAARLRPTFTALGLEVALIEPGMAGVERRRAYACPVVCAPLREVGLDYLRDRVNSGGRPGRLRGELDRLAGRGEAALLSGLHCALVHEADAVMLDEARAPLVIAREVDQAQERLMYEQAMELARSFTPGSDFTVDEEGVALGEGAAALLARLVTPLGGVWAARERREQLVALALEALYLKQVEVDYRIADGRLILPEKPPEQAEEEAARDAILQALLEVKEGCRSSARREVLARSSVPAFLGRYLHLGGVCTDARGLEREFWTLYQLKCGHAGGGGRRVPELPTRVYVTRAAKHAALAEAVREAQAAGQTAVAAVRTPAEAQAVAGVLNDAGIAGAVIWTYPAQPPLPEGRQARLLVAELHDARRHVAFLQRASRAVQSQQLLSLEDERMAASIEPWLVLAAKAMAGARLELPPRLAGLVGRRAERSAERLQAAMRMELASREQQLNDLLAFSGEGG